MTIDIPEDISTHFQNPPLVCDVVMKGGITSGVVYPPAILKLAPTYRFRCIGGTSAGAIAASVAAAAEYNRKGGGFEKLCEIQQMLSKKNFVRDLFQPSSNSRAVMETLLAVAGEKRDKPGAETQDSRQKLKNKLWFLLPLWVRQLLKLHESLLLKDLKVVVVGALVGISLPFGWARLIGGSLGQGRLIIPLLTGWFGALLAGVFHLGWILFNKVPTEKSFYGMCIGHKQDDESSNKPEVLTDWLSNTINDVAGKPHWLTGNDGKRRGNPLTFDDLANKKYNGEGITLQLVTTNLSQSEPYIFPREQMNFIFKEEEMKKFFPDFVVDYMVWIADQPDKRNGPEQPEDTRARSFAAAQQAAKFVVAQQEKSQ